MTFDEVLHARKVLYGAGNTHGNIQVRSNHLARLTYLPVIRRVPCIDSGTGRADRSTKFVCEGNDALLGTAPRIQVRARPRR